MRQLRFDVLTLIFSEETIELRPSGSARAYCNKTRASLSDATRWYDQNVGSQREDIGAAIEQANRGSETAAAISVSKDGSALAIEGGSGTGSGIVLLIGFDRDHQTAIRRGENGGRTLEEANVVRSIRTIGAWQGETVRLTEKARRARMSPCCWRRQMGGWRRDCEGRSQDSHMVQPSHWIRFRKLGSFCRNGSPPLLLVFVLKVACHI